MSKPHIGSASYQCRQIFGPVCCAAPAAIEHDAVVEQRATWFLELLQTAQKVGNLFAEEQVILGELVLSFLVTSVRKVVVCFTQSEFQWEGVANAHAIFTVEHESDTPCDVCVESKRNQIEHIAVVLGRFPFGGGVQVEM